MREVAAVTGPMRSGTSCVTGLLELCGFDLGKNVRVLRNPTEHNPRGHFELDLLYTINERLLTEVPGGPWGILRVPDQTALAELAARRDRYFRLFLRKFDGELCKDPLMCLTWPFWEKQWPELHRAVFCLRQPLAVARSTATRYGTTLEHGLELWHTYTARFLHSAKRSRVFVFDFDAFARDPVEQFGVLLDWFGRPMSPEDIRIRLDGFFGSEYVHWTFGQTELVDVPPHVSELYLDLVGRAGPWD
jgi:hypothetical protein